MTSIRKLSLDIGASSRGLQNDINEIAKAKRSPNREAGATRNLNLFQRIA